MKYPLENYVALVSGSTAGIGLAVAKSLAAEGAVVIVNGRTEERVTGAIDRMRRQHPGAQLRGFVGDLSRPDKVAEVAQRFQRVDILINSLGVYPSKSFQDISDQDWHDILETNFYSGMRLSRAYLPGMLTRNCGRIIFISSEAGIQVPPEKIHYGVTKTMQITLARGLAEKTVGTNVTINSVVAGPTRSEGVERVVEKLSRDQNKRASEVETEYFRKTKPSSLLQRFATNEEVAHLVTYLASPLSSATNGAALRVDGGLVRTIL